MRDIVTRLREAHPNSAQAAVGSTILSDAADEIERLRTALERIMGIIEGKPSFGMGATAYDIVRTALRPSQPE